MENLYVNNILVLNAEDNVKVNMNSIGSVAVNGIEVWSRDLDLPAQVVDFSATDNLTTYILFDWTPMENTDFYDIYKLPDTLVQANALPGYQWYEAAAGPGTYVVVSRNTGNSIVSNESFGQLLIQGSATMDWSTFSTDDGAVVKNSDGNYTFTPPLYTTYVRSWVYGAGGGGGGGEGGETWGGSDGTGGGGGGAGVESIDVRTELPGTQAPFSIIIGNNGEGGYGGSASEDDGGPGGVGTASSFGSISAGGGIGGIGGSGHYTTEDTSIQSNGSNGTSSSIGSGGVGGGENAVGGGGGLAAGGGGGGGGDHDSTGDGSNGGDGGAGGYGRVTLTWSNL